MKMAPAPSHAAVWGFLPPEPGLGPRRNPPQWAAPAGRGRGAQSKTQPPTTSLRISKRPTWSHPLHPIRFFQEMGTALGVPKLERWGYRPS